MPPIQLMTALAAIKKTGNGGIFAGIIVYILPPFTPNIKELMKLSDWKIGVR